MRRRFRAACVLLAYTAMLGLAVMGVATAGMLATSHSALSWRSQALQQPQCNLYEVRSNN